MQEFIDYNFLIIGRSGAGKSATSKLLTGDPSIVVANSINQVTKQVKFYRAISHTLNNEHIRFGILDIPGLDKIGNRFQLRQNILQYLQKYKISLNGIIYVASLTQRDTIDKNKLFQFLDQLPWNSQTKKSSLIPILTKYDNFIIDSPEEDIRKTKEQFLKIFSESGYGAAWGKRVYWINYTKSLQFKLKCYEDIKQKFENQIQRFLQMIRKNKRSLTAQSIQEQMKLEDQFVIGQLLEKFDDCEIPYVPSKKSHRFSINIKIEPAKVFEAMSASSIGIIISRAIKHEIPTPLSFLLMGIPLTLTIMNLIKSNSFISNKTANKDSFDSKIMKDFGRICDLINKQLQKEWNEVNQQIQFYIESGQLFCKICKSIKHRFFIFENMKVFEVMKETYFERDEGQQTKNHLYFKTPVPHFDEQANWQPVIEIQYEVKAFEEQTLIKSINNLRIEFNKK